MCQYFLREVDMEAYFCCCGSFVVVLTTLLVIFVVGIAHAVTSEDGYELGNMVFMSLCIALLVLLIMTSLICMFMCHKHKEETEEGSSSTQQKHKPKKVGACYIVAWNMKILKQSGTECPICWESMDSGRELKAMLSCQHVFHLGCWTKYWKKSDVTPVCPLCRATPIQFPGLQRMKSDVKIFMNHFRCLPHLEQEPVAEMV